MERFSRCGGVEAVIVIANSKTNNNAEYLCAGYAYTMSASEFKVTPFEKYWNLE